MGFSVQGLGYGGGYMLKHTRRVLGAHKVPAPKNPFSCRVPSMFRF